RGGMGLGAGEPEAASDRERHLVAAMRKQARTRPAVAVEHRHGVRILHDAVGLWRVDLDHVAARGLEPAEAHEVLHVLRREQVLAGRNGLRVDAGDLGKERKVERIARLLEPTQLEWRKRTRIGERLRARELRIGIDRKLGAVAEDLLHRLDPAYVVGERQAADLHLHHGIAGVEMAAHFLLPVVPGLAWTAPAAADVAQHLVGGTAASGATAESPAPL